MPPASPAPRSLWRVLVSPDGEAERARAREVQAAGFAVGVLGGNLLGTLVCDHLPEDGELSLALWWGLFLVQALALQLAWGLVLVGGIAAATRRLRLAVFCMGTGGLLLLPFLREHWPRREAPSGPGFTVATANLLGLSKERDALVRELVELDADLLLLVEYTAPWHAVLIPALKERYPHRIERIRPDAFGMALYSRVPFVGDTSPLWLEEWAAAPQLRAAVEIEGRRLHLQGVHTLPPRTPEYTRHHRRMVRSLFQVLEEAPDDLVLLGDFNFGVNTPQHRALLGRGFRDAASEVGAGPAGTWPVLGWLRALPGIRLDHVYVRGALACRRVVIGEGRGSDHRPVMAELVWE